MPDSVKEYFVLMGRKGGKITGKARSANLTATGRSEAARRAVQAAGLNNGQPDYFRAATAL